MGEGVIPKHLTPDLPSTAEIFRRATARMREMMPTTLDVAESMRRAQEGFLTAKEFAESWRKTAEALRQAGPLSVSDIARRPGTKKGKG